MPMKTEIIPLLIIMQVLNGALLPIILVFILLLINDARLTGSLKNTRVCNVLGWGTLVLVSIAVGVMLLGQLFDLFGLHFFGGGNQ